MRETTGNVRHRRMLLEGVHIFYREAGSENAPVVLLPHGYPCSSFEFRNFIPALADRWRLLAPDFQGCRYSDTPNDFAYDFDGYADFLDRFTIRLGVRRYALYLHDFGSQIGLRLSIKAPERTVALIIQNGDIYEDELGPKYKALKEYWANPSPEGRAALAEAGFRDEFLNDVRSELVERITPDLWKLHWSLMTPERRTIALDLIVGLKENLTWFPRYQAYLRERQPPTLIVWGPQDGYMPEMRRGRIYASSRMRSCICSTADIGRWRQTAMRSCSLRVTFLGAYMNQDDECFAIS